MFWNDRVSWAAALASLALVACGGEGGGEQAGDEQAEGGEQAAAPTVDPATAATISGRVAFTGEPPAPEPIDMSEEPACAEAYTGEGPTSQHVVVADGGLGNVFVYVKEGISGEFPVPEEPVTLDQQNCRYHPHVLGIQVGQPLEIVNSDSLLHNINTQPEQNRGFNISQPQAGMETTRDFAVSEVMVPVQCDVHGWMNAYIGVVEHPYYAVSSETGGFEIGNLPPGDYVIEAWHERYGTLTDSVTLAASQTAEVTFTFSEDMAETAVVPLGEPLVLHTGDAGAGR